MSAPAITAVCPPRDELTRFCRGDLNHDRLEEVAEHLESCAHCQSLLDEASRARDELLSELRQLADFNAPPDDAFRREIADIESKSSSFFGDTLEEPAAEMRPRVGEYAILEPIGRGGMGTVYRAVHTRLEKVVALKALSPHRVGDASAVARFEREMRAVGKLSHPNIVAATDAGEIAGAPFLVMEFVDGIDVARLVKRHGPLRAADACEIARQAAIGLQYAHQHKLVHRDIKPSNLLLTQAADQPSGGLVKVADLGLARLHEPDPAGSASSTDLLIGSLDYMAPEQVDDAHQVDERADLYSLGCTLYELLAGRAPFALPGQTRLQKLKAHAATAVPSLADSCPKLPAGLEPLVRRLLAKNPAERIPTAAELASALAPFTVGSNLARLLDEASAHVPTERALNASPPRRLRPMGIVLGCLGALALASVIYVQTDRGTLEIQSDDDEVKVRVEQDGKLITLVDLKTDKEVRLRGGTYHVTLGDTDRDLALDTDELTLQRGGKEVLHIRRQPPALLRPPFDADEAKRYQECWGRFCRAARTVKNELGMALTLVPPGEFEMRPGYRIKITKPYYLGTYEVTVDEFRQFAEATGHKSLLEAEGRGIMDFETGKELPGTNWRDPRLARGDDHPVAGVTWFDAERFCVWLSERDKKKYRLPTEAEWEWAARSGTASKFGWGDDSERVGDYEWYAGNSDRHSHAVGQKPANAWGLYDTNGNVVEWCQDWAKDPYPQVEVSDPAGPTTGETRSLRGGSFVDPPLPYSARGAFGPTSSMIHCGFRVCREL
ncbi:MAG TPA: bifunctional serine/threonine-protein kinase/formylglycine-generating enzyme family protein [Pirellulales bacterium]|nr:bifunctional serine/threonine-protein kinase/formylglycine-generating enzyme family protein [Pirellulales bacterium]